MCFEHDSDLTSNMASVSGQCFWKVHASHCKNPWDPPTCALRLLLILAYFSGTHRQHFVNKLNSPSTGLRQANLLTTLLPLFWAQNNTKSSADWFNCALWANSTNNEHKTRRTNCWEIASFRWRLLSQVAFILMCEAFQHWCPDSKIFTPSCADLSSVVNHGRKRPSCSKHIELIFGFLSSFPIPTGQETDWTPNRLDLFWPSGLHNCASSAW